MEYYLSSCLLMGALPPGFTITMVTYVNGRAVGSIVTLNKQ